MAFYGGNPFGPRHEDLRCGILASLLHGPYRKPGRAPAVPEDFFPSLKGPGPGPGRKTSEELAAKMHAFAAHTAAALGN